MVYTSTPEVNVFYSEICGKTFNNYEEYKQHLRENCLQCNNSGVQISNNLSIEINTDEFEDDNKKKIDECETSENSEASINQTSDKNDSSKKENIKSKNFTEYVLIFFCMNFIINNINIKLFLFNCL